MDAKKLVMLSHASHPGLIRYFSTANPLFTNHFDTTTYVRLIQYDNHSLSHLIHNIHVHHTDQLLIL